MAFIVTLTLCVVAHGSATAPGPALLAARAGLQEPEEVGGPPSAPFEAPPLCPEPLECEPRWSPLELTAEGRVVFSHPTLEPLAEVLSEDLAAVTGLKLAVAGIPARSGDVVLSLGYMPALVRENPEAFFIEVFDHVLIAGQTLDGAARATARFLQLVRPPEAAPSAGEGTGVDPRAHAAAAAVVTVPPVRIVDAPSVRWRVLEVRPGRHPEESDPATRSANARRLVALAHLSGHNAIHFRGFAPIPPLGHEYGGRALSAEASLRRIDLVSFAPGPLIAHDPLGDAVASDDEDGPFTVAPEYQRLSDARVLRMLYGFLDREDTTLLCSHDPFPNGVVPADFEVDEATAVQRLPRVLHPIPPVGRATDSTPLLGELYGHRVALGGDVFLPAGWKGKLGAADSAAPLAGEAWHGGMRIDSLRGTPELERVLAAVEASIRQPK